jgi:hypothetical protein
MGFGALKRIGMDARIKSGHNVRCGGDALTLRWLSAEPAAVLADREHSGQGSRWEEKRPTAARLATVRNVLMIKTRGKRSLEYQFRIVSDII